MIRKDRENSLPVSGGLRKQCTIKSHGWKKSYIIQRKWLLCILGFWDATTVGVTRTSNVNKPTIYLVQLRPCVSCFAYRSEVSWAETHGCGRTTAVGRDLSSSVPSVLSLAALDGSGLVDGGVEASLILVIFFSTLFSPCILSENKRHSIFVLGCLSTSKIESSFTFSLIITSC